MYPPSGGTVIDTSVHVEGSSVEAVILAGGSPYVNGLRVEAVAESFGAGLRICVGVYDENYASAGYTICP